MATRILYNKKVVALVISSALNSRVCAFASVLLRVCFSSHARQQFAEQMGLHQVREALGVVQSSLWVSMLGIGAVIMHDCWREKAVGPYLRTKGACVVWFGPATQHVSEKRLDH